MYRLKILSQHHYLCLGLLVKHFVSQLLFHLTARNISQRYDQHSQGQVDHSQDQQISVSKLQSFVQFYTTCLLDLSFALVSLIFQTRLDF